MELRYEQRDSLPRLAWCAHLSRDEGLVTLRHGPWVETRPTFFCEGAWNGEFAEGRLDRATVLMGSGGVLHDDRISFASPTHCLELLYVLRDADEIRVANSLAFLLAEAEDGCDPGYTNYLYQLMDFHGSDLRHHRSTLPTARRKQVHLYQRCNVVVTRDLEVETADKLSDPRPENFEHYVGILRSGVEKVSRNALSNLRRRTYSPVTLLSSGYDSTACAVLAKEVGCVEALTFSKASHSWGDSHDDSGAASAAVLGMSITDYDWRAFEHYDDFPEAEFCACGTGEDINLLAMEDAFAGRMVFSGSRGDHLWERTDFPLPWWTTVSFGLNEFRLRVGFIHMAPGWIGQEFHGAIGRISSSLEMSAWSVADFYDRPIPRRIAEEAGIPRSHFGQVKKGTAFRPLWQTEGMTEKSRVDFYDFASAAFRERTLLEKTVFRMGRSLFRWNERSNRLASAVAKGFGKQLEPRVLLSLRYRRRHRMVDLTFNWGQQKIRNRYAVGEVR